MDKNTILHLANLAKIKISEDYLEKLTWEFNQILDFVSRLQEIDTTGVEKMYTPIENLKLDYNRKTSTQVNSEDLLSNSPHEIENNMIVIRSSIVEH